MFGSRPCPKPCGRNDERLTGGWAAQGHVKQPCGAWLAMGWTFHWRDSCYWWWYCFVGSRCSGGGLAKAELQSIFRIQPGWLLGLRALGNKAQQSGLVCEVEWSSPPAAHQPPRRFAPPGFTPHGQASPYPAGIRPMNLPAQDSAKGNGGKGQAASPQSDQSLFWRRKLVTTRTCCRALGVSLKNRTSVQANNEAAIGQDKGRGTKGNAWRVMAT